MAINPLQQPINYAVDVQSPFEAALGGLKLGAGLADIDAAQQKRQLEANALQQAQQRQTDLANLYKNPNATSADYARVAAFLPKDQAAIVTQGFERLTKEQQQSDLRMGGEVYSAIKSGNLDVAKRRLTEKAAALRNSGRENEAKAAEDSLELINLNPTGAQATIGLYMARLPGGKDFLDNADKALSTLRSEQLQPSALATAEAAAAQAKTKAQEAVADLRIKLQNEPNEAKKLALEVEIKEAEAEIARPKAAAVLAKAVADSTKAVADAQKAFDEAKGTPLRLVREQELLAAQANKAATEARVAQASERSTISKAVSEAQEAAVKAKFAEQLAQAGLNKTNWDIKNLQSQITDRTTKLNLDKRVTDATVLEKMSSIQARLTDIPEGARKLINESATLASTSKQAATQYNDLARRIEAAEGGKGAVTTASEWFAKTLGSQDAWTQIRNEYTRVRNSVAIKSLPPGVATDKDIELALKGIPPENANAATLASFLRGSAKLQDIDSSINNAKTDWLSQNNGLLTRAKSTFIAGDYAAKPGETFNDFAQRIVGDVSQKYRSPAQIAEEQRQQSIGRIPTNAAPAVAPTAPAASPANIMTQADAILRGGR